MAGEYRIKDLETLTGIKAHTLRIWEKRYGLLSPHRTETKIRCYSNKELVKLLSVSILYNNGYKISKIADFSELEICEKIKSISSSSSTCGTDIALLFQAMIELKCDYFNTVLNAMIQKKGVEESYRNCLRPFLERIDAMWSSGRISQVQKHFVINSVRQKIIAETENLPLVEKDYFDAVLFTPEGEYFEMDLLFYNYILKTKKQRTLYLGTDLPINDIERTLKKTNPKSLLLCINKKGKYCYVKYIKELMEKINLPIYIGGNLADTAGGEFYKIKNLAHVERILQC